MVRASKHSLELFHKYDVDGGGGLDPDEFAAMIRDMAYEEWFPASSNGRQYFFNIKTKFINILCVYCCVSYFLCILPYCVALFVFSLTSLNVNS